MTDAMTVRNDEGEQEVSAERSKHEFNILVIEDNEAVFNELKNGLSDTNYKLWRASTATEALKLIKDGYFIAIISELLPIDMDGIELVRRLKKISKQINILVLTTYAVSNDMAVEAMKAGAFAYLQKPLNMEEMKLVLRRAIENSVISIQAGREDDYQDNSNLDGLTGVYNHRYFHETLDKMVSHLKRLSRDFSLFMIDVDRFTQYNDTNGYMAGDKILYDIAKLLEQSARDIDMVFRYGGEKFAMILPRAKNEEAQKTGQGLVELIRKNQPVTVSIGLAFFPAHAQTKKDLVIRADKALYRAKESGGDRLCVCDEKADL
jgi:diguanylate cyclase (GGDEF)-like protein